MPDGTSWASFEASNFAGVARGTHILTEAGECRVERIRSGDSVRTSDGRLAKVASITETSCRASGRSAPIRVFAGVIGNQRELIVAPGQVLSVGDAKLSAKKLADAGVAEIAYGGIVTYFEICFDEQVVVSAEGALIACSQAKASPTLAIAPASGETGQARVTLI